MKTLTRLIKEIEEHTGEPFNFDKRRHKSLLGGKVERLYSRERNQLNQIKTIIKSDQKRFEVINPHTHRAHKIPSSQL